MVPAQVRSFLPRCGLLCQDKFAASRQIFPVILLWACAGKFGYGGSNSFFRSASMSRVYVACAVAAGLSLLQACSLNPFGKAEVGPSYGTTPAAAGSSAGPKRVRESAALKRFDGDTNGSVTRSELEATLTADFKKEDVNADEQLDTGETRALNERLRQQANMSPVFDWNADGRLVYAEFATQWRTLFDRADRDRNGVIDAEELEGNVRDYTPRTLPPPTFSGKDGRPPGSP
jgi:Ca2+-binding EF-hand superfamily protein